VENLTAAPIHLQGWTSEDHEHGCKKKLMETVPPPNTVTINPHENTALGGINNTHIIAVAAPLDEEFPHVAIYQGGKVTKDCISASSTRVLDATHLGVGQQVERTIGHYRIVILREHNIDKARVFWARLFDAV
jgi:hypothetical protein